MVLPWYALQEGLDFGVWLGGLWSSEDYASGLGQLLAHGKWWLTPVLAALVACLTVALLPLERERQGTLLLLASGIGLVLFVAQASASACAAGPRTGSTPPSASWTRARSASAPAARWC